MREPPTVATTTALTATRPVTDRGHGAQVRSIATQTTVAVVWPEGNAPPWAATESRGPGTASIGLRSSTDTTTRPTRSAVSPAIRHRCRRHAASEPRARAIGSVILGSATSQTVLHVCQSDVSHCDVAESWTEWSSRLHQPNSTDKATTANNPSSASDLPAGRRSDSVTRRWPPWLAPARLSTARDSTDATISTLISVAFPEIQDPWQPSTTKPAPLLSIIGRPIDNGASVAVQSPALRNL